MKKKIVVNGYFVKNIGDDLFLKVLIQEIPDIKFSVLNYPKGMMKDYYESFQNVQVVRNTLLKKLTKYLPTRILAWAYKKIHGKVDIFILLGGSMFIENIGYDNLLKKRELDCAISRRMLVIGSNFGPYESPAFFKKYAHFLSKVDSITWRDASSFQLFRNQNIDQKLLPDVVLGLDVPHVRENGTTHKYVLINIMKLPKKRFSESLRKQYLINMENIITNYFRMGYSIHILSVNATDGDSDVAKQLKMAKFATNSEVDVVEYENIDDTLKEFEFASLIVTTRYHAMILAWLYQKPVHVLAYSDKVINFINTWNADQKYTDLRVSYENIVLDDRSFSIISDSRLQELHLLAKKHFSVLKALV